MNTQQKQTHKTVFNTVQQGVVFSRDKDWYRDIFYVVINPIGHENLKNAALNLCNGRIEEFDPMEPVLEHRTARLVLE